MKPEASNPTDGDELHALQSPGDLLKLPQNPSWIHHKLFSEKGSKQELNRWLLGLGGCVVFGLGKGLNRNVPATTAEPCVEGTSKQL